MAIPLIESSDKIRAEKCLAAIKTILQQFDCELLPRIIITGLSLEAGWLVVPKPRIPPAPAGDSKMN